MLTILRMMFVLANEYRPSKTPSRDQAKFLKQDRIAVPPATYAETPRQAPKEVKSASQLSTCIACGEGCAEADAIRVPCEHVYCPTCLRTLFMQSIRDHAFNPPVCCYEEIDYQLIAPKMSAADRSAFEDARLERSSKNKTYCSNPRCSKFISQDKIRNPDYATCECGSQTCLHCKAPRHAGDCEKDETLQATLDTADAEQWQRCPRCRTMVELTDGCDHIKYVELPYP